MAGLSCYGSGSQLKGNNMCQECMASPEGQKLQQALLQAQQKCSGLRTWSIDEYIMRHGIEKYTGNARKLLEEVNTIRNAIQQLYEQCWMRRERAAKVIAVLQQGDLWQVEDE